MTRRGAALSRKDTSSESISDLSQLLCAAIESDASIDFDQLWPLIADRLVVLTRRMLRHYPRLQRWEQTDDVFQTAAMRLNRAIRDVRPDSSARFWGLAIAQVRRTLIDLARHHFGPHGQARKLQDGYETEFANEVHSSSGQCENEPVTLEDWTEFHEAVDHLPSSERDVFQLIWYAELSQQQVADTLNVSVPTVQRRVYRARLLLHDFLSNSNSKDDVSGN